MVTLTRDEFDALIALAELRGRSVVAVARIAIQRAAQADPDKIDTLSATAHAKPLPLFHRSPPRLRSDVTDPIPELLTTDAPLEAAEAWANGILGAYDEESCYLAPGAILLGMLFIYAAFEPSFAWDRSLPGVRQAIDFGGEAFSSLLYRMMDSRVRNGYVAVHAEKQYRKQPGELAAIQGFLQEALSVYFEEDEEGDDSAARAEAWHLAIDLPPDDIVRLRQLAQARGLSVAALARLAILQGLHNRPHLVLVKS